jgi:hypothetical protein
MGYLYIWRRTLGGELRRERCAWILSLEADHGVLWAAGVRDDARFVTQYYGVERFEVRPE